MQLRVCFEVAFLLLWSGEASTGTYKNYKVFSVLPTSFEHVKTLGPKQLEWLHANTNGGQPGLQFWDVEFVIDKQHKVLVPPMEVEGFVSFCVEHQLDVQLLWEDFESVVQDQETKSDRLSSDKATLMNWETYHRYSTITNFYLNLETNHPDLVRRVLLGQTYEGRNMWILKIGSLDTDGTFTDLNKPAIWVDAGIHGNEWISSATVTYMLNQLVTNESVNWMYENANWYFLPMINLDGFEYAHTNERLWRKTRRIDPFSECMGTDANRNYDFMWQKVKPASDPCTITYGGSTPYSEPENLLIFDTIMDLKRELRAFLTFHSYSQLWMPPYGYTLDHTPDYPDLYALAINATEALRSVYGTEYRVGTPAEILYKSSGTSRDFVKGRTRVKYVFTIELRDTGEFEFLLPADQILPSGRETFEGLKTVARRVIEEFGTALTKST